MGAGPRKKSQSRPGGTGSCGVRPIDLRRRKHRAAGHVNPADDSLMKQRRRLCACGRSSGSANRLAPYARTCARLSPSARPRTGYARRLLHVNILAGLARQIVVSACHGSASPPIPPGCLCRRTADACPRIPWGLLPWRFWTMAEARSRAAWLTSQTAASRAPGTSAKNPRWPRPRPPTPITARFTLSFAPSTGNACAAAAEAAPFTNVRRVCAVMAIRVLQNERRGARTCYLHA